MNPVDIDAFLEDKTVKGVIDKNKGSEPGQPGLVILAKDSDTGLEAGDRKITKLTSGKYYKIEEVETDDKGDVTKVVATYFVKARGAFDGTLGEIGKLSGTVITGLTNDTTYRVKPAIAYTNPLNSEKIDYFALSDTSLKSAPVANGEVTIPESRGNCFFDLSKTIDAAKYYEVMRVSATANETGGWQKERTSAYRNSNPAVTDINSSDYWNTYVKFNSTLDIGIFEHDPIL